MHLLSLMSHALNSIETIAHFAYNYENIHEQRLECTTDLLFCISISSSILVALLKFPKINGYVASFSFHHSVFRFYSLMILRLCLIHIKHSLIFKDFSARFNSNLNNIFLSILHSRFTLQAWYHYLFMINDNEILFLF